jgi:predicted AAA+ superfamily ATPase
MPLNFQRPFVATLTERFAEETPLIQVLAGPRQVGKTTGVRQMLAQGAWPHHYANADELAVGAELVQQPGQLFYWLERNDEVDFVYQYRDQLYAIEVKSGRKKSAKGLGAFSAQFPQALRVIMTPENFAQFSSNPRGFLQQVAV